MCINYLFVGSLWGNTICSVIRYLPNLCIRNYSLRSDTSCKRKRQFIVDSREEVDRLTQADKFT